MPRPGVRRSDHAQLLAGGTDAGGRAGELLEVEAVDLSGSEAEHRAQLVLGDAGERAA